MRRHLRLASFLLPLAALTPSCSDDNATPSGEDLAMKPDMARMKPDLWMPTGCIKGSLKDEQGTAVGNVAVLNCTVTTCTTGMAGPDGSFNTCGIELADIAVKTEEECGHTPRYGAGLAMVTVKANGDVVDLKDLIIPIMGAGTPIDWTSTKAATLDGGDGVSVTLTGKDLFPLFGDKTCTFSARSLLPGKRAEFKVPDGGQLLGVYVMSPFSTRSTSKTKFPFKAKLPAAATPGAAVKFWWLDYDASGWAATPAMGKVDANDATLVATNPGDGLGQLSYVLVSK